MNKAFSRCLIVLLAALLTALAVACGGSDGPPINADQATATLPPPRGADAMPAWLLDRDTWRQATAVYQQDNPTEDDFKRWAASPNGLIRLASLDRAIGTKGRVPAPGEIADGRLTIRPGAWTAQATFFDAVSAEGGRLTLELSDQLAARLNGAAVDDDPALATRRLDRLGPGRPVLRLRHADGAIWRILPDGTLVGPRAPKGARGLFRLAEDALVAELTKAWLDVLAAPGDGDTPHFQRLSLLLAGGFADRAEGALLALDAARPATDAVNGGELDLALYLYYQERAPDRAVRALTRLVRDHPEHPYVRPVGLMALSQLLFTEREWLAYRNLWREMGEPILGAIPPEVTQRLTLIERALAAEIRWEADPDKRHELDILGVIEALEQLPDFERAYVWIQRRLAENPNDLVEKLRKGRTLIKLMRFDEAETFLRTEAENTRELPSHRLKFYELLVSLYKIRGEDGNRRWAGEMWQQMQKRSADEMAAHAGNGVKPPPPR